MYHPLLTEELILQKLREDHNRFATEIDRYSSDIGGIQELHQQDR